MIAITLSAALDRLTPCLADAIESPAPGFRDDAARLAREILADDPAGIRGRLGAWIIVGRFAVTTEERARLTRALRSAMNDAESSPARTGPASRPD